MTVAAMLKHKGHEVVSVHPDDSVAELARILTEHRIGAAVVLDTAGQLQGVVSERDIVVALADSGAAALDMPAAQLMTREIVTATRSTTVAEAMQMMTEHRFRHLPVVENGRLLGIVSIGDVVKARIMAQEGEVESLKAYVAGAA
jgi:CBS domain-containing protein